MGSADATFTIELGAIPLEERALAAEGIASAFGLAPEQASALVARAPIALKHAVTADGTRALADALLRSGLRVTIVNERTGERLDYDPSLVGAAPGRPSSLPPAPAPVPGPSEARLAQPRRSDPPRVSSRPPAPERAEPSGTFRPPSLQALSGPVEMASIPPPPPLPRTEGSGAFHAPSLPPPPGAPGSLPPPPLRQEPSGAFRAPSVPPLAPSAGSASSPPPPMQRAEPSGAFRSPDAPARAEPSGAFRAPTSGGERASFSPPSAAKKCPACHAPMDRGHLCRTCGWDSVSLLRTCPKCNVPMSVGATAGPLARIGRIAAFVAAPLVGGLVGSMAGEAARFGGALVALAAVIAACSFVVTSRCATCAFEIAPSGLTRKELAGRKVVRGFYLGAAGLAVVMSALAFATLLLKPSVKHVAGGESWSIRAPRLNRELHDEPVGFDAPWGMARGTMHVAAAVSSPLRAVVIFHVAKPDADKSDANAVSETFLRGFASGVLKGAVRGAPASSVVGGYKAVEGDVLGTFLERPTSGRIRVAVFDHAIVGVAVLADDQATAESNAALAVFDSLDYSHD